MTFEWMIDYFLWVFRSFFELMFMYFYCDFFVVNVWPRVRNGIENEMIDYLMEFLINFIPVVQLVLQCVVRKFRNDIHY